MLQKVKGKLNYLIEDNSPQLYRNLAQDFGWLFCAKRFVLKNLTAATGYQLNVYKPFMKKELKKHLGHVAQKYATRANQTEKHHGKIPVFVIWLQGLESAPDLVRMCLNNQKAVLSSERYDHHLVTLENLKDYLTIPAFIFQQLESGRLSYTNFADIVRIGLLKEYGGLYLDATIFLKEDFDEAVFDYGLYSNKKTSYEHINKRMIANGRWASYFMIGQKNQLLFAFMWEAYLIYLERYHHFIDHFLIDYLIDLAYDTIPSVRQAIDAYPVNNLAVFDLIKNLNSTEVDEVAEFAPGTSVFKLSYKQQLLLEQGGKETLYAKLLNTYGVKPSIGDVR